MRDSICELLFLEHCKFFETARGGQKIKERIAFPSFFLEVIQEIVYKNGYKRAIRESPLWRGRFFEEKHFLAEKEGEY